MESVDTAFLTVVGVSFAVLCAVGALTNWLRAVDSAELARFALLVSWAAATAAAATLGWGLYGLWSVAPAAIATGAALTLVYAITGSPADRVSTRMPRIAVGA